MLERVNDLQSRPKRVRLDRDGILEAVMTLAREEPQSRLTMKRLGEKLGVDGSAIYRHFRDREGLAQAATDHLIGRAAEEAHASTGTWRERLEAHFLRLAELCLEHPSVAAGELISVEPVGPGSVSALEFILETLTEAGLSGEALIDAYAAVSGYALAQCVVLANDALNGGDHASDGSAPWISTFGSVNLTKYPLVRQHLDALLTIDGIAVYRAGITKLLDAIAATAAAG